MKFIRRINTFFEIIEIANNELKSLTQSLYLHGSLASMDYVKGWSDVDMFIILSRNAVTNKNNLLHIRKTFSRIHNLMKKVDPLQHHGLILDTEIDFKSYTDQIIPSIVFKKMKNMLSCPQIKGIKCILKPGVRSSKKHIILYH